MASCPLDFHIKEPRAKPTQIACDVTFTYGLKRRHWGWRGGGAEVCVGGAVGEVKGVERDRQNKPDTKRASERDGSQAKKDAIHE